MHQEGQHSEATGETGGNIRRELSVCTSEKENAFADASTLAVPPKSSQVDADQYVETVKSYMYTEYRIHL